MLALQIPQSHHYICPDTVQQKTAEGLLQAKVSRQSGSCILLQLVMLHEESWFSSYQQLRHGIYRICSDFFKYCGKFLRSLPGPSCCFTNMPINSTVRLMTPLLVTYSIDYKFQFLSDTVRNYRSFPDCPDFRILPAHSTYPSRQEMYCTLQHNSLT